MAGQCLFTGQLARHVAAPHAAAGAECGDVHDARNALLFARSSQGSHGLVARYVRAFAADGRPKSARWFRAFNELPTVLFIAIVLLAVFRPF